MGKHRKHAPHPPHFEKDESEVRWLISYSDFMMQLVCLFILLYSVATMDPAKGAKISAYYRASIGLGDPPAADAKTDGANLAVGDRPLLGGSLAAGEVPRDLEVQVEEVPGGWRVSFTPPLFEIGSSLLTETGKSALDRTAAMLRPYLGRVEVTGYAGDVPEDAVEGDPVRLAAARAAAAAAHLSRAGFEGALDSRTMTAVGSVAENDGQSRRVSLRLRAE